MLIITCFSPISNDTQLSLISPQPPHFNLRYHTNESSTGESETKFSKFALSSRPIFPIVTVVHPDVSLEHSLLWTPSRREGFPRKQGYTLNELLHNRTSKGKPQIQSKSNTKYSISQTNESILSWKRWVFLFHSLREMFLEKLPFIGQLMLWTRQLLSSTDLST